MVRVTLSNGEYDEIEAGVFNHGVVHETLPYGREVLRDVASGRPVAVHQATFSGRGWIPGAELDPEVKPYAQAFIQQVPLAEQRMILGAELDMLVMEQPHCAALIEPGKEPCDHDHCRKIRQTRARLEEVS